MSFTGVNLPYYMHVSSLFRVQIFVLQRGQGCTASFLTVNRMQIFSGEGEAVWCWWWRWGGGRA